MCFFLVLFWVVSWCCAGLSKPGWCTRPREGLSTHVNAKLVSLMLYCRIGNGGKTRHGMLYYSNGDDTDTKHKKILGSGQFAFRKSPDDCTTQRTLSDACAVQEKGRAARSMEKPIHDSCMPWELCHQRADGGNERFGREDGWP
ncbi:hypothetical protein BD289DRAFT_105960 [Coniella lustricola]|uniref:Secreted protein n=1 Tax=Coniella lustricola TaxID=2025994 RepID=A0A2T2ZXL8_9PEZI|nr:hypothetical protein BD289DRAFT_105960 [Coniella lustricola]